LQTAEEIPIEYSEILKWKLRAWRELLIEKDLFKQLEP